MNAPIFAKVKNKLNKSFEKKNYKGKNVLDLFRQINQTGTTVIIVTHDSVIGSLTPRQITILDGKIISDGKPGAI